MIENMIALVGLFLIYLILDYVSHYENMMFGGYVIPQFLCIFCLLDRIKEFLGFKL